MCTVVVQEMRSEFFVRGVVMLDEPSVVEASSSPATCRAEVVGTNHMNKGKAQRDRRKLREKRRSTGVVHLPSTESTGGSTGEDDDEEVIANEKETRKNTQHNELPAESGASHSRPCQDAVRGNLKHQQTSASDLEADDEENGGSGTPSSTNNDDLPSPRLTENGGAASASTSSARRSRDRNESSKPADILGLLEKSLEENQKLSRLLESRNQEIAALEAAMRQMKAQLGQVGGEVSRLKEENAALIKAMGSLTNQ